MSRTERATRWGGWGLAGMLLFGFCLLLSRARGFNLVDESWFLQVGARMYAGEVLYRDVFLGTTPLAAYLTLAALSIFGVEMMVLSALVTGCLVVMVGLACRIARQLGLGGYGQAGLAAALVITLPPSQFPWIAVPYTPLANLLLLACLSAVLAWLRSTTGAGLRHLALAGVAAGLCFATKPNLGLYGLAALLALVVLEHIGQPQRLSAAVALIAVCAGSVAAAALAPTVALGGGERFMAYTFVNKSVYLRDGAVSYGEQLAVLGRFLAGPQRSLEAIFYQSLFVLPLLTPLALLGVWVGAEASERQRVAATGLFVGAGLLGLYPRSDLPHLAYQLSFALLGLAYALHRLTPRLPQPARVVGAGALLVWLGLGATLLVVPTLARLGSAEYRWSSLPHFQGLLITADDEERLRRDAEALRSAAREGTLLLSPFASLYYLLSGLQNPTPYDYMATSVLGVDGADRVVAAIQAGKVRAVCVHVRPVGLPTEVLDPVALERYVAANLEPGQQVAGCRLHYPRR